MRTLILRGALLMLLTLSAPTFAQTASDTAAGAEAFVVQAGKELAAHSILASRADWINRTYITEDTDAIAAEFGARGTEMSVRLAKGAAKFDGVKGLSFDVRRQLDFLKQGIVLPAPEKPGAADELNVIASMIDIGSEAQYEADKRREPKP